MCFQLIKCSISVRRNEVTYEIRFAKEDGGFGSNLEFVECFEGYNIYYFDMLMQGTASGRIDYASGFVCPVNKYIYDPVLILDRC